MVRSTTNWKMRVPPKGIQTFCKTLNAKQNLFVVESDLLTTVCNPCGPKFLLPQFLFLKICIIYYIKYIFIFHAGDKC